MAGAGDVIGGYTLVRRLGSGGMGTVWQARDEAGSAVALKLLHPAVSADPHARQRLAREVASLNRVRGSRVARVLDAEIDADLAFVVTQLIEGLTLEDSVAQEGAFDPVDLYPLARGLHEAVTQVHRAGLLHRDIKPGNVMVTYDGPVLIDFGIAQLADDSRLTHTGFVTGTPGYLDPASLEGGHPGREVDWYGWAAVLLFAATGRAPFGRGRLEVVLARMTAGSPDTTDLPPGVAAAFRAALAKDPAHRPDPSALLRALDRFAQGLDADVATQVVPPPPGPVAGAGSAAVAGTVPGAPAGSAAGVPTWAGGVAGAAVGQGVGYGVGQGVAASAGPPPAVAGAAGPASPGGNGTGGRLAGERPGDAGAARERRGRWRRRRSDGASAGAAGSGAQLSERPAALPQSVPFPTAVPGPAPLAAWERPPPPRWALVALSGAGVAALAARWPGWAVLLTIVGFITLTTAGLLERRLRHRRLAAGRRRSDPWYVVAWTVPMLAMAVVLALLPLLIGGVVTASLWWIGTAIVSGSLGGEPPAMLQLVVAPLALAAGLAAAWWVPVADVTRVGARAVWRHLAPGPGARQIWVAALIAVVCVLALLGLIGEITWTPLPRPPGADGL